MVINLIYCMLAILNNGGGTGVFGGGCLEIKVQTEYKAWVSNIKMHQEGGWGWVDITNLIL